MCSSQAIGRLERNYSDLPSYKKNSEINQSWDMFILVILHTLNQCCQVNFVQNPQFWFQKSQNSPQFWPKITEKSPDFWQKQPT